MLQNQRQYRTALEAYADVITTYPGSEGAMISEMRMAEIGIQDPELLPRDGDVRLQAYHYPIDALRLLIQKYPMNPLADVARFKLGTFQLQHRQMQAALTEFRALLSKPLKDDLRLEVQAKYRQALQSIMAEFHRQGQHAEVLHTFFAHKGMLSPQEAESPDFLLPLALSYARLGLFPEAQSLFKAQAEALVTPQQGGAVALEQALVLMAQGLLQEAKKLLKSAIAGAEGTPRGQILLALGKLALQTGQPAEAVPYLLQGLEAVSSPPERATLFALLGEGYAALGQEKEGLQAFQQCKDIALAAAPSPFPSAETCLFRAAELLFAQRQVQPALAAYQQLLTAFPQTRHHDWVLLRIATLARGLADLEQMQHTLAPLQQTAASPLWHKVATEALEEAAWQQQFHERLAEFQNSLMR
jgi:tetratricopeptide (TPR) repeat protein